MQYVRLSCGVSFSLCFSMKIRVLLLSELQQKRDKWGMLSEVDGMSVLLEIFQKYVSYSW